MEVLYEDNHIIIINKQISELVQGDATGDATLGDKVKLYLKEKYQKPGNVYLGVTHRLDRPVSGVVMFARTSKALSRLNDMFKNKQIQKEYWALVKDLPPSNEGRLEHYLRRDASKNKTYVYAKEVDNSKLASLQYKVIGQSDNYFLLKVILETGRHHQIRAQLAHIGCPIKGDLKYNFKRSNKYPGIALHARRIVFKHPVSGEEVNVVAQPPDAEPIWALFKEIE